MSSFKLTIVCPDGCLYEGPAEYIRLRTTTGDIGILAHHIKFASALGMGLCEVQIGETRRKAACIGGMLTVADNEVNVVSTTFEWAEDLDLKRAEDALARAEARLAEAGLTDAERKFSEAAKKRAMVRISVIKNSRNQ